MVKRDLRQIIDHVAPAGHQGTANIAQTRHVSSPLARRIVQGTDARQFLRKMSEKSFLSSEEYTELDNILATREPVASKTDLGVDQSVLHNITKEDIFRRIEEDRERHKRLRESLWVVPTGDDDWEFQQAWENTSELCDVDFEIMREEMSLCKQSQGI